MSFVEDKSPRAAGSLVRDPERASAVIYGTEDGLVERLLGTAGAQDFRRDVWERNRAVLTGGPCALGADWVTLADIDQLIAAADFPPTNLDLADGTQPLPKTSYAPGGAIDRGKMFALHQEGATIILRAAHRWSGKLRRLCACAEWEFGFPVQANVYLTPASRKSTPPHWDTHDLFILQVVGVKGWRLFDSDYRLPLDSQRFSEDTFATGPIREEIDLREGEVLYLPRGSIHEPVAQSYSIHISLGVLVSRWTDLLHDLVDAAGESRPELREAVTLSQRLFGAEDRAKLAGRLCALAELLQDGEACDLAVRRHISGLLAQHGDVRDRQLLGIVQRDRVTVNTPLRRVKSAYLWVDANDGRIEVNWRRGRFSLPADDATFLETVLGGGTFTLASAPQQGKEEHRLAFCEALVRQGLLEAADS